jgi:hypothetical protein
MSRTAVEPAVNFSQADGSIHSARSVAPVVAYRSPLDERPIPYPISMERAEKDSKALVEILDSSELALRLKVKESWVIEQSKRSRTADPLPVLRLGKHRRYRWGSPEMTDWLARRIGYTTTTRKAWS